MTDIQRSGQVLIVGAGPAGMAVALELLKWGVQATLIDALKTPRTTSRAGGIQPRTYELLDRYDISRRIIAGKKGINGFTVFANGKQVAQMPSHLANSRYRQPPGAPQAVIEQIFRDVLAADGIRVLWNHELIALEQDETGATARIKTSEGIMTFRADWVIGCDGAHSRTRELVGLPFEGESYPESYGLMDAQLEWELPPDTLRMFRNDDGPQMIVIVPFDDEFYRIQINNRPIEMERSPPTVEEMQAVYNRLVPFPGKISNPSWSSAYRLHRKQVTAYRRGRVFVAGDAAHVHSPAGAQGLNTGVQDGINLGWKLGLVINGAASSALLDTYEAERRPIAAAVLKLSDTLGREPTAFLAANIPPQVVADTAAQLLVNYRPGPLGREMAVPAGAPLPPGTPPGAGDRLPDVELEGKTVYSGLRDARIVVVLFGDESATATAAERFTRFKGAVDIWRHRAGDALAKALGMASGAAVIRPDAYLGLVVGGELGSAAAQVDEWLERRLQLVPAAS